MTDMYNALDAALRGIDAEHLPAHIEEWCDSDIDDLYNELMGHIGFNQLLKFSLETHIHDVIADIPFERLAQADMKSVIRDAMKTHEDVCKYVAEFCHKGSDTQEYRDDDYRQRLRDVG